MTKDRSQVACSLVKGRWLSPGNSPSLWIPVGGGTVCVLAGAHCLLRRRETTVCLGRGPVTHCLLKNQEILGWPALEDFEKGEVRMLWGQGAGSAAVTCKLSSKELRHQSWMADRLRVQCEEKGGFGGCRGTERPTGSFLLSGTLRSVQGELASPPPNLVRVPPRGR